MKQSINDKITELLPLLPNDVPVNILAQLHEKMKNSGNAMIFRCTYRETGGKRKRMVEGLCTACKTKHYLKYVPIVRMCNGHNIHHEGYGFAEPFDEDSIKSSYDYLNCPTCREKVMARGRNSFKAHFEMASIAACTVHSIEGHLAVLSWEVTKRCNSNGEIWYSSAKRDGIIVVNGKTTRLTGYNKYYYNLSELLNWKVRSAKDDRFMSINKNLVFECTKSVVESTDSANSAVYVFAKESTSPVYIMAYLQAWCKYPQIENLVRQGFSSLVNEYLSDCYTHYGWYSQKDRFLPAGMAAYINVDEVKPHRMLGIEKTHLEYARHLSKSELKAFKVAQNLGVFLEYPQLCEFVKLGVGEVRKIAVAAEMNGGKFRLIQFLNYMSKQRKRAGSKAGHITVGYYTDYLDSCLEVYGEIADSLRYPRDLIKSHNRMLMLVEEKIDTAVDAQIRRRAAALEPFSYVDNTAGLILTPCGSHEAIIKEGKLLDHCVARYAKKYASGETAIFFVRKVEAPDIPYYTLEYKNGKISQNHGYDNELQTPEILEFEKGWLNYIAERKLYDGSIGSEELAHSGA